MFTREFPPGVNARLAVKMFAVATSVPVVRINVPATAAIDPPAV